MTKINGLYFLVTCWLNAVEKTGWLCVYENVTNYEEIKRLIPTGGGQGSVIIFTSKHQKEMFPSSCEKRKVDLLSIKHCVRLMKSYVELKGLQLRDYIDTDKDCKNLAEKLNQLPTPIAQALAHITSNENDVNNVADYIKQFDNNSKLKKVIHPYYAAFSLTAKEIKKVNPIAFEWLRLCSYLYSEGIPEILLDHLIAHKLKIDRFSKECERMKVSTIKTLRSYGIMDYAKGPRSFTLPRAVQGILKQIH